MGMYLAAFIKSEREKKGLSRQEVCNRGGFSLSYLASIELGRREPQPLIAAKLAGALSIPFDRLIHVQEEDILIDLLEDMKGSGISESDSKLYAEVESALVNIRAEREGHASRKTKEDLLSVISTLKRIAEE